MNLSKDFTKENISSKVLNKGKKNKFFVFKFPFFQILFTLVQNLKRKSLTKKKG